MTIQIPDSLTIDGKKLAIIEWEGDFECIPSSKALGFETVCTSADNWLGRIDHFLVHRNKLLLFKIEVNLHPNNKDILPLGTRREIVQRYEPIKHWDKNSMKMIQKLRQKEYLIFDHLPIEYTGTIVLGDPCYDYWELPKSITDDEEQGVQLLVEASFERSHLVGWFDE